MPNKFTTIARQEAGLVPGYQGADEGDDDFARRDAERLAELHRSSTSGVLAVPVDVVDVTGLTADERARIDEFIADVRS